MKHILKIFTVGFCLLLLPLTTNAANFIIEGEVKDNIGTYEIKYAIDEEKPDEKSFQFNIIKIADNTTKFDLKISNSVIGKCDDTLSCTIINETTLTEGTVLATLTITNESAEEATANFVVEGKENTKTTAVLKAGIPTTEAPLSNDTSLTNLSVSNGTMDQTFNKDITAYTVTGIKDTINTVRITPDCEKCSWEMFCPNGECSIKNTNVVQLQIGVNKVSVVVTSEDLKNNKTYLLTIYRGDIELNSAYLENILLKNTDLSPNFDSMVNDYTATVGLDVDKLEIETIAEDPNANIVIKGNENFKIGENTVTITVTSNDGQNKQVYTIIVTKEEIEEEITETEKTEEIKTNKVEKKQNNTLLIIILSIVALALIISAYIIIFKIKKKKKDKNDKNDKNNKGNKNEQIEKKELPKEKTTKEKIEDATKELIIPSIDNEPKQDVDEALKDLMRTKQLELGELDF